MLKSCDESFLATLEGLYCRLLEKSALMKNALYLVLSVRVHRGAQVLPKVENNGHRHSLHRKKRKVAQKTAILVLSKKSDGKKT